MTVDVADELDREDLVAIARDVIQGCIGVGESIDTAVRLLEERLPFSPERLLGIAKWQCEQLRTERETNG